MEFEEIRQKLDEALNQVLRLDRHLLIHDINEPTISHRLGVYLEPLFPDFDVDCEYNGNVDADNDRKYIRILQEDAIRLNILREGEEERYILHRYVYPDIIIHKRGQNDNNLLIIENKKSSNPNNADWDFEKLKIFTSPKNENRFNYQYGVFVRFIVGENPTYRIQWFQNGICLRI